MSIFHTSFLLLLLLVSCIIYTQASTQTLRQQAQAVLGKVDSLLVWGASLESNSKSTSAFLPDIFTHLHGEQYVHSTLCTEAKLIQSQACKTTGGNAHISSCQPHVLIIHGFHNLAEAQAEHTCLLKYDGVILKYLNSPQCKGVLVMQTQDHSSDQQQQQQRHGATLYIQHAKIRYIPIGINADHAAALHNNLHNHPMEACRGTGAESATGAGVMTRIPMLPITETKGAEHLDLFYRKISCSLFVDCRTSASTNAIVGKEVDNDWDSTRVWETLSLGAIPVLARVSPGQGAHMLDGLPVLWVEKGEMVTSDSLNKAYNALVSTGVKYHYKRLTLSWWVDKVHAMAAGGGGASAGKKKHGISGSAGVAVAVSAAAALSAANERSVAAAYRASPKCSHPRPAFTWKGQVINPATNCTVGWRNPVAYHAGQNLEDAVVLERFFGRGSPLHSGADEWLQGGTFLEIGGLDGITFSNTLFMEQCLGWQGVLVEASPINAELLFKNRPCAFNYAEGVCQPHGQIFISQDKGTAFDLSTRVGAGTVKGVDMNKFDKVPCRPLSDIVLDAGFRRINVMFVDVEGAEFKVLQTFDFDAIQVDVLIVETTMVFTTNTMNLRTVGIEGKVNDVRSLMKSKGFYRLQSRLDGKDKGKDNSKRCVRMNSRDKPEKINCMFLSVAGSDVFVRSMDVFKYDGGGPNEDSL